MLAAMPEIEKEIPDEHEQEYAKDCREKSVFVKDHYIDNALPGFRRR